MSTETEPTIPAAIKESVKFWGAKLALAAQLAMLENDVTPLMKLRRRLPLPIREALKLGLEPNYKLLPRNACIGTKADGSDPCGKIISRNKLRCLACHGTFIMLQLERIREQRLEKEFSAEEITKAIIEESILG